jgi:carboxyl-terminal processing protease
MIKWRRPFRLLFVVVGLAIGASLAPSLSSCSSVNGSGGINHARTPVDDQSTQVHLDRFEAVYKKYASNDASQVRNLSHFRDALLRVRYDYVRDVGESELVDTAIAGIEESEPKLEPGKVDPDVLIEAALDKMMTSLDPHSSYLNSNELKEMKVSNRGEFGGLGIEVTMDGDFVKVVSPIEGTPASKAGIISGDLISHLDGVAIKGKTLIQAVRLMRGKPGADIRLTINRAEVEPFDVTITRAIINVRSVRWHLEGDIGYIRVVSFSEKVAPGIDAAMQQIKNQLGDKLAGIVLDLRNNPGGLLQQSLTLSDAFLEKGTIVSVRGRRPGSQRVFKADAGDYANGLPVVVLINPGSASASEIVAGALQDHRRAIIMGQQSFGKGSVQTITPLPQEGALRLTTQLYYSPSGRAIQARGITPDIEIIPIPRKEQAQNKDAQVTKKKTEAQTKAENGEEGEAVKKKVVRRREADLPGALSAVGDDGEHPHPTLPAQSCKPVGEKEDRALGCALALIHAGSSAEFLASVGQSSAM